MSVFDTYEVSFVSTYSCVAKPLGMSDLSASSPFFVQVSAPGVYERVQTTPVYVVKLFAFSASSRELYLSLEIPLPASLVHANTLADTSVTRQVSSTLPSLSVHGPYVPGAEESVLTSPFP